MIDLKELGIEIGDTVKVTGGPYYLAKFGNKIPMGEKGVGQLIKTEEDGSAIYVKISGMVRYVYMGSEHTSDTGTIMVAHKVTKFKEKK
jgi:hypothetical protein